jgi:hypothetical protein
VMSNSQMVKAEGTQRALDTARARIAKVGARSLCYLFLTCVKLEEQAAESDSALQSLRDQLKTIVAEEEGKLAAALQVAEERRLALEQSMRLTHQEVAYSLARELTRVQTADQALELRRKWEQAEATLADVRHQAGVLDVR